MSAWEKCNKVREIARSSFLSLGREKTTCKPMGKQRDRGPRRGLPPPEAGGRDADEKRTK